LNANQILAFGKPLDGIDIDDYNYSIMWIVPDQRALWNIADTYDVRALCLWQTDDGALCWSIAGYSLKCIILEWAGCP